MIRHIKLIGTLEIAEIEALKWPWDRPAEKMWVVGRRDFESDHLMSWNEEDFESMETLTPVRAGAMIEALKLWLAEHGEEK